MISEVNFVIMKHVTICQLTSIAIENKYEKNQQDPRPCGSRFKDFIKRGYLEIWQRECESESEEKSVEATLFVGNTGFEPVTPTLSR